MPWCPKCKSEYREGFTVCADCGSELVDDEQFAKLEEELLNAKKEETAKLYALAYEEAEAEKNDSGHKAQGYYDEFSGAEGTEPEEGVSDAGHPEVESSASKTRRTAPAGSSYVSSALYQDSAERANENRSSAWILLALGSIGIVFTVLGIAGVIPLKFSNSYLFFGVMAAVFILFLVSGIVSMKNAKIFQKRAESENSLRDTMLAWCRENLRAEEVDRILEAAGESEEILYFKRFEYIKERLNYQFVNLDQGFLDNFIDDSVYDMIFGKNGDNVA